MKKNTVLIMKKNKAEESVAVHVVLRDVWFDGTHWRNGGSYPIK